MPYTVGRRKIYLFGEIGSSTSFRSKTPLQSYNKLSKECLHTAGKPFEDQGFIPSQPNILPSKFRQKDVRWLRPTEIIENPIFVAGEFQRDEMMQGSLGDCWFVAAISSLVADKETMSFVVPPQASFNSSLYCGLFYFRLWYLGHWFEVCIDDRLPCDIKGNLLFSSSSNKEFWGPLLEKAFAKLHGGFNKIEGGFFTESLSSLTGGVGRRLEVDKIHWRQTWLIIKKALDTGCHVGSAIYTPDEQEQETVLPNGLVLGHAYSVIGLCVLKKSDGQVAYLLKLRNPWGRQEWTGAWGSNSNLWKSVPPGVRQSNNLINTQAGEFLMSCEDFCIHFNLLEIMTTQMLGAEWRSRSILSEWIPDVTTGGAFHEDTYVLNPCFILHVQEKSSIVLSLLQDIERHNNGQEIYIGLDLFMDPDSKIPKEKKENVKCLPKNHEEFSLGDIKLKTLLNHLVPLDVPQFSDFHELQFNLKLQKGCYAIVPFTTDLKAERKFLLRVFQKEI